ncbi:hypothetical protein ACOMHN_007167 [Nucella lapillus]
MLMMRARVQGHRWVDHPAAAVMEARVPGQWVDRPAAVVMEAREQGRCWIDHPAAAVMEARVQGRHWVDRPSIELATEFPYSQWPTPFDQIRQVVEEDPPRLPLGRFSSEFEDFVVKCLQKDPMARASYMQLLEHPFLQQAKSAETDMGGFITSVIDRLGPLTS